MVSAKNVEKFKKLYLKQYGVSLSNKEATQMANDLVNLMRVLLKPI